MVSLLGGASFPQCDKVAPEIAIINRRGARGSWNINDMATVAFATQGEGGTDEQ